MILAREFGEENIPGIVILNPRYKPNLFISDPDLLTDLYITKNKYFEKHQFYHSFVKPQLGHGLVFV